MATKVHKPVTEDPVVMDLYRQIAKRMNQEVSEDEFVTSALEYVCEEETSFAELRGMFKFVYELGWSKGWKDRSDDFRENGE